MNFLFMLIYVGTAGTLVGLVVLLLFAWLISQGIV